MPDRAGAFQLKWRQNKRPKAFVVLPRPPAPIYMSCADWMTPVCGFVCGFWRAVGGQNRPV